MDDPKIKQSLFGPRVRLAPSPTGWLHVGTARTALLNYVFARKHGGKFVLRIEDTDPLRSKKKYIDNILEGLKWLGINWDEGPEIGGPLGPYFQSERAGIYEPYLRQLIKEGKAYYCFCTKEELEAQKEMMISQGLPPKYSGRCRDLSEETIRQYQKEGKPSVIRFKMPTQEIKFQDLIRGEVKFNPALIGDIVIAKSFREPLYNFAVVIDDYLMKISHVIRGEDHISNTPKQLALQEALGLPRPIYAHLPLILGEDRSKLSKRHGSIALSDYKKAGYLPQAMFNFLALLGWHPEGEGEIMSSEELINKFDLERVQKGGAIFNIRKLDWFNAQYLRRMSGTELTQMVISYIKEYSSSVQLKEKCDPLKIQKIIEVALPRATKLSDFITSSDLFFQKELSYTPELLQWKQMGNDEIKQALTDCLTVMGGIKEENFNKEELRIEFYDFIDKNEYYQKDKGKLLWPLRVSVSGKKDSPGPFEIAEILGKEETIKRIKQAINKVTNK